MCQGVGAFTLEAMIVDGNPVVAVFNPDTADSFRLLDGDDAKQLLDVLDIRLEPDKATTFGELEELREREETAT
jgi:hypothetical protein